MKFVLRFNVVIKTNNADRTKTQRQLSLATLTINYVLPAPLSIVV